MMASDGAISELQHKLNDMTQRLAHETRYVQECAPVPAGAGEKRVAAMHKPPFEETRESLEQRAEHTAHAIVALNLQVEKLLGMLPADDVGEHEQMQVLEQLILENRQAGEGLGREKEKVRQVLRQVHAAMQDVSLAQPATQPPSQSAPLLPCAALWPPLLPAQAQAPQRPPGAAAGAAPPVSSAGASRGVG
eukprot:Tamp_20306.p1 GENE.Tamp_20306~~Tamp_20306.p1  ORF type:complete len:192 (+),score=48.34 Tamp_20306:87-662(+)